MKPFVIAACGRSGTMGMASLLSAAGIRVSFEDYFRTVMPRADVAEFAGWLQDNNLNGEVSGLSPPYLKWVEPDVTVLHQVRNPVAVIASLMGLRNLYPESHWSQNIRFNFRHLPEMRHSDGPIDLCMKYWHGWNALIEPHAEWQYKIEDIGWDDSRPDYGEFENLLSRISSGFTELAAHALGRHPSGCNSRPRDTSISWRRLPNNDLKSRIRDAAHRYGYTDNDLEGYCPLSNNCPHCAPPMGAPE